MRFTLGRITRDFKRGHFAKFHQTCCQLIWQRKLLHTHPKCALSGYTYFYSLYFNVRTCTISTGGVHQWSRVRLVWNTRFRQRRSVSKEWNVRLWQKSTDCVFEFSISRLSYFISHVHDSVLFRLKIKIWPCLKSRTSFFLKLKFKNGHVYINKYIISSNEPPIHTVTYPWI